MHTSVRAKPKGTDSFAWKTKRPYTTLLDNATLLQLIAAKKIVHEKVRTETIGTIFFILVSTEVSTTKPKRWRTNKEREEKGKR